MKKKPTRKRMKPWKAWVLLCADGVPWRIVYRSRLELHENHSLARGDHVVRVEVREVSR